MWVKSNPGYSRPPFDKHTALEAMKTLEKRAQCYTLIWSIWVFCFKPSRRVKTLKKTCDCSKLEVSSVVPNKNYEAQMTGKVFDKIELCLLLREIEIIIYISVAQRITNTIQIWVLNINVISGAHRPCLSDRFLKNGKERVLCFFYFSTVIKNVAYAFNTKGHTVHKTR